MFSAAIKLSKEQTYPAASISEVANFNNTNNNTVYTFTTVSFGTADASRIVAIIVSTQATISSATIGGVSATVVGSTNCYIIYAAVPTGTSGTVVVTHTASTSRCAIRVYRVIPGKSGTPDSSITDGTAATTSSSLAVKKNSVVLVTAGRSSGNGTFTMSWSGADTLTYGTNAYSSSNYRWAEGYIGSIASSYSGTFTTSTATKFVAICWR